MIDVLETLRELNLPLGQYVVVGGACLAVRGWKETSDLDIVVTPALFKQLRDGGWRQKPKPDGGPGLRRGPVEVYLEVNCETVSFDTGDMIETADVIGGFPFLNLDMLMRLKAGYGREKDLADLALIASRLEDG